MLSSPASDVLPAPPDLACSVFATPRLQAPLRGQTSAGLAQVGTMLPRLWLEMQSLPVHEVDAGLTHLLDRLCTLLTCQSVEWVLTTTAPSGRTRTLAWHAWPVSSSLNSAHPNNDHRFTHTQALHHGFCMSLTFRRPQSESAFQAEERALVGTVLAGLHQWLNWLALSHQPPCDAGIPPQRHRKVLLMLLTGQTEKEIASTLGMSVHTVHRHVTLLFRQFGVRNRPSLVARWLGHASHPSVLAFKPDRHA